MFCIKFTTLQKVLIFYTEKTRDLKFAEGSKILLNTNMQITSLNYQNNFILKTLKPYEKCCKK